MIIINSGMPESGTSLTVRYQRDLIATCYLDNGIDEVWNRYKGFVDTIDASVAGTLRKIHDDFGPFAIKTHAGPTPAIRDLIDSGLAKASFSFRDPRDTVLSALDHAERTGKGLDPTGAFGNLRTMQDAINFTRGSINLYTTWITYGRALFIRYEDFMADKMGVLKNMMQYFELDLSVDHLQVIYDKHESLKSTAWNFNKGTTDRWKSELSASDLALCDSVFGKKIEEMGYERVTGSGKKTRFNLRTILQEVKRHLNK